MNCVIYVYSVHVCVSMHIYIYMYVLCVLCMHACVAQDHDPQAHAEGMASLVPTARFPGQHHEWVGSGAIGST